MNNLVNIEENIKNKIYTIRGVQVMLDKDLASLYGVETKRINEAVKRNTEKFPSDLMFELSDIEYNLLKSQNATSSSSRGGRRYLPKVFTEQGVYMLATVLKSKIATDVVLSIMRTFTNMKTLLSNNIIIFDKLTEIEKRQLNFELTTNNKINKIFDAISDKQLPIQGIFYDGQMFDAYIFVNDLLKTAKKEISLIDNYIDEKVLTMFSKYPKIKFTIITKSVSRQMRLDIDRYNKQYNNLKIKISDRFHDRFLVIDRKECYHLGASLKDLGKKIFGFSKIDVDLLKDFDM